MVLNGWHRLWIVIAASWVLVVVGLATLEYHVGQYEIGDGFFTCWEPYGSSPSAPVGKRGCGILARPEVTPGAFGSVLPGTRYLNNWRFSATALGPVVILGFGVLAVSWIVHGFRRGSQKQPHQHAQRPRLQSLSGQPIPSPRSHSEAWLDRLPWRWARNAAVAGGLVAAPSTLALLSKGDGAFAMFMLIGLCAVSFGSAGAAYLSGRWARFSLKGLLALNPASALTRITPNWVTGAILLGAVLLASDAAFGWRGTTPLFAGGVEFRDWGYLIGFFGTWTLGGYLTALISKRGLRKAIDADRKHCSARTDRPPAPHGNPLQREYSIG